MKSLIQIRQLGNACVHRVYAIFTASDGNIIFFCNLNFKDAYLSALFLLNQINISAFKSRRNFKKISCYNFPQLPVTSFIEIIPHFQLHFEYTCIQFTNLYQNQSVYKNACTKLKLKLFRCYQILLQSWCRHFYTHDF